MINAPLASAKSPQIGGDTPRPLSGQAADAGFAGVLTSVRAAAAAGKDVGDAVRSDRDDLRDHAPPPLSAKPSELASAAVWIGPLLQVQAPAAEGMPPAGGERSRTPEPSEAAAEIPGESRVHGTTAGIELEDGRSKRLSTSSPRASITFDFGGVGAILPSPVDQSAALRRGRGTRSDSTAPDMDVESPPDQESGVDPTFGKRSNSEGITAPSAALPGPDSIDRTPTQARSSILSVPATRAYETMPVAAATSIVAGEMPSPVRIPRGALVRSETHLLVARNLNSAIQAAPVQPGSASDSSLLAKSPEEHGSTTTYDQPALAPAIGSTRPNAAAAGGGAGGPPFPGAAPAIQIAHCVRDLVGGSAAVPGEPATPAATSATTIASATPDLVKSIRLALHPADLGQVDVRLTLKDGALHVQLRFDREDAAEVVRSGRAELTDALASSGLAVEGCIIDVHKPPAQSDVRPTESSFGQASDASSSSGRQDQDRRRAGIDMMATEGERASPSSIGRADVRGRDGLIFV